MRPGRLEVESGIRKTLSDLKERYQSHLLKHTHKAKASYLQMAAALTGYCNIWWVTIVAQVEACRRLRTLAGEEWTITSDAWLSVEGAGVAADGSLCICKQLFD